MLGSYAIVAHDGLASRGTAGVPSIDEYVLKSQNDASGQQLLTPILSVPYVSFTGTTVARFRRPLVTSDRAVR
jgi:hypothetical protein